MTDPIWEDIKQHYGNRSVYCGSMENIGRDHITPRSLMGGNGVENIVPACQHCNSKKQSSGVPRPIQPLLPNGEEIYVNKNDKVFHIRLLPLQEAFLLRLADRRGGSFSEALMYAVDVGLVAIEKARIRKPRVKR